jgi:nicotinic acid mononucleotide adenylyltransferase
MYLCGADRLITCRPATLRQFGCISCSRPGFTKELERIITARVTKYIHIVDDDELLTSALDSISSTKIRKRIAANKSIAAYVTAEVDKYVKSSNIGERIRGLKSWQD